MNKTHLNKYVEKYGWDKIRGLKDSTKREQGALGHRHLDAVCGLVNLETLLRLKIAKKIATV